MMVGLIYVWLFAASRLEWKMNEEEVKEKEKRIAEKYVIDEKSGYVVEVKPIDLRLNKANRYKGQWFEC